MSSKTPFEASEHNAAALVPEADTTFRAPKILVGEIALRLG